MSLLRHVTEINRHDLSGFKPFFCGESRVGWVRHDFADALRDYPDVFEVGDLAVRLAVTEATPAARSAAIAGVLPDLEARGLTPQLRGEMYRVDTGFGGLVLFEMDRGAVDCFGVYAYGVHVNGYVRSKDGLKLWIGKRAPDKAVAPSKLDNLVAGGLPAGMSLIDNLIKEAAEEAAIDEALGRQAHAVGVITYCRETRWGLKPDVLFCYDLEVPETFEPRNTDGELVGFTLMSTDAVLRLLRETDDFKFNVTLVVIDFFIRHGILNADNEPDYLALCRGVRAL